VGYTNQTIDLKNKISFEMDTIYLAREMVDTIQTFYKYLIKLSYVAKSSSH
jgi:hypothetical protein